MNHSESATMPQRTGSLVGTRTIMRLWTQDGMEIWLVLPTMWLPSNHDDNVILKIHTPGMDNELFLSFNHVVDINSGTETGRNKVFVHKRVVGDFECSDFKARLRLCWQRPGSDYKDFVHW
jgi:hypothetical protein